MHKKWKSNPFLTFENQLENKARSPVRRHQLLRRRCCLFLKGYSSSIELIKFQSFLYFHEKYELMPIVSQFDSGGD